MRLRYMPIPLLVSCLGVAVAQDTAVFTPNNTVAQQTRPTAHRTLAGSVVNSVTGEPIRRALVSVQGSQSRSTFTGQDGRFEISDLTDGTVYLAAQRPGFFPTATVPAPAAITLGSTTGEIVLKLAPEAKIRGRVLDKTGEPIESLSVQLLAQAFVEGRKQWQMRGQATTDDSGVYQLDNLTPGVYAIHTLALAVSPLIGMQPNGEKSSDVFPPTYYPDAPDRFSVQPIELKAGQELPIDMSLKSVTAYRVSGIVSGGQGPLQVICEDADGQPVAYSMAVNARTGKFTLSSVPPGSWTLHAMDQSGPNTSGEAEQPIEVTSSDIKNVVLQLQPLPSIPVHVPNQSENQGQPVLAQITPVTGNQLRNYAAYQDPKDPPGSLSFHGVPPGKYRVSVRSANNSECIDSVMSGNSDLLREELTVITGSQPPPIEITLRQDCATIAGSVHSSSAESTLSYVLVLSNVTAKAPTSTQSRPDGTFSISNLTPGAYRVFAFNDISDLEYANPEALRDFTGQEITVGPNEKANVQLDLIARSK